MKKISLLLAFVFLMTNVLCLGVFAEESVVNANLGITIADFENYDVKTSAADLEGYTLKVGNGTHWAKIMNDPKNSNNKVIGVYAAGNKQNTELTYAFEEISGASVFQYNYFNTRADLQNDALVYLRNGTTNICNLGSYNGYFRLNGTLTAVPAVSETWYHIAMHFIPGKSVTVYINGDRLGTVSTTATAYNSMLIYNRASTTSNYKTVCLDNIRATGSSDENAAPVFDAIKFEKSYSAVVGEEFILDVTDKIYALDNEITLTSDKGVLDGNILKWTPDTAGVQEITLTADDGIDKETYQIKLDVVNNLRNSIIDYEKYELDTSIEDMGGYELVKGTTTHWAKVIRDPLNASNKVLGVYTAAEKQNTEAILNFKDISETTVFDFNYMNSRADISNDGLVYLRNGTTDICNIGSYGGYFRLNGTITEVPSVSNTWYHIAMHFIPGNSVTVYINGALLGSVETTENSCNILNIFNRTSRVGNSKTVYIDNIKVTPSTENNMIPFANLMPFNKIYNGFVGEEFSFDVADKIFDPDSEIILNTDTGAFEGTILKWVPDTDGSKIINVTASDELSSISVNIKLNVLNDLEKSVNDFEKYPLNTSLEGECGYNLIKGSATHWAKVISDPYNSSNKVLGVYTAAVKENTELAYMFKDVTIGSTIDFKYMNSRTDVNNDAKVYLRNGATVIGYIDSRDGYFSFNDTVSDIPSESSKWYNISFFFVPGKSVSAYVDGTLLGTAETTEISYNTLNVLNRTSVIGNYKTVYIDDIRLLKSPDVLSYSNAFVENTSVDGNTAYVFAKITDAPGFAKTGYGVLLSTEKISDAEFNTGNINLHKAVFDNELNDKGQYGIKFMGNLKNGIYYARPFVEYSNGTGSSNVVYGDIVTFSVNE